MFDKIPVMNNCKENHVAQLTMIQIERGCLYNMVISFQNAHNSQIIAGMLGRTVGCIFLSLKCDQRFMIDIAWMHEISFRY